MTYSEGDLQRAGRPLAPRKREIVAVSMGLFAQRGFQATTVRDIADAVGILSGSLYSHFASKDEILDEGLEPYIENSLRSVRLVAVQDVSPVQMIRLSIERAVEGLGHSPDAAAVLHQDWEYLAAQERYEGARALRREFDDALLDAFQAAQSHGDMAADVDPVIVLQYVRAVMGGILRGRVVGEPLHTQRLADHLNRMILIGLGA